MIDQLLYWDQQLFLFLNQLGSETFDFFWLLLSEKATNAVIYLSLVVIYGKKHEWSSAFFLLLVAALMVGFTDQLTNLFKHSVLRLRPCYTVEIQDLLRLVKDGCGGKYGFFSGHASNSFALAFYFALVFSSQKKICPLLLSIAALIAYSRVYLGVHFPLDIVCGALVGISIASAVYFLVNKQMLSTLPNY